MPPGRHRTRRSPAVEASASRGSRRADARVGVRSKLRVRRGACGGACARRSVQRAAREPHPVPVVKRVERPTQNHPRSRRPHSHGLPTSELYDRCPAIEKGSDRIAAESEARASSPFTTGHERQRCEGRGSKRRKESDTHQRPAPDFVCFCVHGLPSSLVKLTDDRPLRVRHPAHLGERRYDNPARHCVLDPTRKEQPKDLSEVKDTGGSLRTMLRTCRSVPTCTGELQSLTSEGRARIQRGTRTSSNRDLFPLLKVTEYCRVPQADCVACNRHEGGGMSARTHYVVAAGRGGAAAGWVGEARERDGRCCGRGRAVAQRSSGGRPASVARSRASTWRRRRPRRRRAGRAEAAGEDGGVVRRVWACAAEGLLQQPTDRRGVGARMTTDVAVAVRWHSENGQGVRARRQNFRPCTPLFGTPSSPSPQRSQR